MNCRGILQRFVLCLPLACVEIHAGAPGVEAGEPGGDRIDGHRLVALAGSELAGLRNLACTRTVTRSYRNSSDGLLRRIDVISAVGGYVDGRDEETPVMRNGRQLKRTIRELKGNWSTGEFGALLAEEAAVVASRQVAPTVSAAKDAWLIRYHVSSDDSVWDLSIGGRHWRPGYEATITVDQASGHITRITRTVDDIAPECPVWRFRWRVEYEPRSINDRKVSVPVRARYENCQKSSSRCDVNEIVFSDYREFRGITTIIFADAGTLVRPLPGVTTPTTLLPSR
jgi:hypothetical protein